jgi:hypothetical protein
MSPLDLATTPVRAEDGRWRLPVSDAWRQGRGAYGGLMLASLVRAMDEAQGDRGRVLRAVTATLGAPLPAGVAEIACEVLRAGSALTSVAGRIEGGGAVCAHASAVFARDRAIDHPGWDLLARPTLGDWREVPVAPVEPPLGPAFARFFEFRPIAGIPFSGGAPTCSGWIRARVPGAARDGALLVALADAWWPCALVRESAPRPTATIAFTLDVLGDLDGLDPSAPLFCQAQSAFSRGGYAIETRELWGHDGRPLAVNHQTFAVIK